MMIGVVTFVINTERIINNNQNLIKKNEKVIILSQIASCKRGNILRSNQKLVLKSLIDLRQILLKHSSQLHFSNDIINFYKTDIIRLNKASSKVHIIDCDKVVIIP